MQTNPSAVSDIVDIIDCIAPFSIAEPWDNSGLQAGDPRWPVKKIMVALDVSPDAMAAAAASGCNMLVTHHPLVISPEKSIDFSTMPGSVIFTAAKEKIAVVSAHTNLDKADQGLNDYFARKIDVDCDAPFQIDRDADNDRPIGIGRIGRLPSAMTADMLAGQIKQRLGIDFVRVIGKPESRIRTVALCTGSGGSLMSHFLGSGADMYITGDIKYHEARDIEAAGKVCIDVGHFASEHIVVELLTRRLEEELASRNLEVEVLAYNREKDPFRII